MRTRTFLSLISTLVVLIFSIQPHLTYGSTTYHVATSGDDSGNGTELSPWRTIAHGVANLKPGETLIVHEGVYNEAIDIELSGTEYARIRIAGEGQVVVNGEGIDSDGIVLRPGASFLELDGLRITGFPRGWGLALYGNNSHIILRDIEVDHCETGIRITVGGSGEPPEFGGVDDVTLEGVHMHHNNVGGFDCTPGPCYHLVVRDSEFAYNGVEAGFGADGFAVEIGDHVLVERVSSHNNGGDGVDIGSRNPLIGNTTGDITVRESKVYANEKNGLKLWSGGIVVNSIVYSNGLCGLVIIYDESYEVVNSLVTMNGQKERDYGMAAGFPLEEGLAGNDNVRLTIFNSIFAFNAASERPTGVYIGKGVRLLSDYNVWYSRPDEELYLDAKQKSYSQNDINSKVLFAETGNDEHSISSDPAFVNMKENDFNLLANSPGIDAGTEVFHGISAPVVDISGHNRPYGKYEIGPIEYGSSSEGTTSTLSTVQTSLVTASPATASSAATLQQTGTSEYPYLIVVIMMVTVGALGAVAVLMSRSRRSRSR